MATPVDANYLRARAALLDALAALGPLRQAAVLVGAQAVYEHTRDSDAHFVDAPRLVIEVRSLLAHETSRAVTTEALSRFPEFFEAPTSTGTQMAVQHVEGLEDSDFIAASLISLGQELIDSIPDNSQ